MDAMEFQNLQGQMDRATEHINCYSNRPGAEAANQWYYWLGRRDAYQEMLDSLKEKATV